MEGFAGMPYSRQATTVGTSEPRPLDGLELALLWREIHARRAEWQALLDDLERGLRAIDQHERDRLAELGRLEDRLRELAAASGTVLSPL